MVLVVVILWMNVDRANAARANATTMLELNPRNDIFDSLEMPPSMQRMGVRRRAEMAKMWVAGRRGRRMCNWLKNTNSTTTAPPQSSMRASKRTIDLPVLPAQAVPRSMYVWGVPMGRRVMAVRRRRAEVRKPAVVSGSRMIANHPATENAYGIVSRPRPTNTLRVERMAVV